MQKRKVINSSNRPIKLPVQSSVLAWLLLDKLNASDFAFGVVYCLFVIIWVLAIVLLMAQEDLPEIK